MLPLNQQAVRMAMELLIFTNGQTSTLEVKNLLRELGYNALQMEISSLMNAIFHDHETSYTRSQPSGSGYFTYSYNLSAGVAAIDDLTAEHDDDDNDNNTIVVKKTVSAPVATDSNVVTVTKSTNPTAKATPSDRDPDLIYYTENTAKTYNRDAENWIVFHKDKDSVFHIYNKLLTRDQVRSRYASMANCKMADVRSCKFSNYNF